MAAVVPFAERFAMPVRRALRNDFLRHGALVFGSAMAGNVFSYLFNFALSRRLGVEGFATLSSLVSGFMILSIPTVVLTMVVVKYAAAFHAAGDAKRIRRLSTQLLKGTSIAAVAMFLVGMLLRGSFAGYLRISNDGAVVLCLAIMALGIITPSARAILQGEQDFMRYSISTILETLIKLAAAVALVYAGYGVAGAMGGWIVGTATSLLYTIWAVLRKHAAQADRTVHLELDLRRLLRTTAGVGAATALLTIVSFMDVLLVKHYFAPHQAGLYAAVNLTGKVVLFMAGFVPAVVLPKAIAKTTKGENPVPLLLQALLVTACISAVTLGIFGVFSSEVVRAVAGRDFIAAAPYVFQYDAAMALLAIVTVLVNYKIGIHNFDFLYGLLAVLILEVSAIATFHQSLWDVIHVLLLGNALAVVACCLPLGKRSRLAAAHKVPEHA